MVQKELYLRNLRLLKMVFGREYSIAISSNETGTPEWQVMPDELIDYPFFDWYCAIREDNQFFVDMDEAVSMYIHYYIAWITRGCPTSMDYYNSRENG